MNVHYAYVDTAVAVVRIDELAASQSEQDLVSDASNHHVANRDVVSQH